MSGVNKAMILGHLGNDPDVRSTDNGTKVANFSVATNNEWKDKDGNKQSQAEWHRVVAWGKLAEICGEYLKKGKQVYIEGRIQTRKWEKDGKSGYTTEIVASNMQMLGSSGNGGPPHPAESGANPPPQAQSNDNVAL